MNAIDLSQYTCHLYSHSVAGWNGWIQDGTTENVVAFIATDGEIVPVETIQGWNSDNDENNLSPFGEINWK